MIPAYHSYIKFVPLRFTSKELEILKIDGTTIDWIVDATFAKFIGLEWFGGRDGTAYFIGPFRSAAFKREKFCELLARNSDAEIRKDIMSDSMRMAPNSWRLSVNDLSNLDEVTLNECEGELLPIEPDDIARYLTGDGLLIKTPGGCFSIKAARRLAIGKTCALVALRVKFSSDSPYEYEVVPISKDGVWYAPITVPCAKIYCNRLYLPKGDNLQNSGKHTKEV